MPDVPSTTGLPHASLWRRLAAMVYDSLLLAAVLAIASALLLPFLPEGGVRGFNPFLTLYFLLAAYLFYAWFWTHGGQTLGMRAWRMQIRTLYTGAPINERQAAWRFALAIVSWLPLGTGFLWSWFDRDALAWHDRFSGTVLVVLPKRGK